MNKLQAQYLDETHKIPVFYDDDKIAHFTNSYISWLEEKLNNVQYNVLADVLEEISNKYAEKTGYALLDTGLLAEVLSKYFT